MRIAITSISLCVIALLISCDDEQPSPQDTEAPNVVSTVPLENATDVAIDANIEIQFDEGLDITTVTNEVLQLFTSGVKVDGTVLYDGIAFSLSFAPTAALAFNTLYDVELAGSISDNSQNTIAPKTWSFTTIAETGDAKYMVTFEATWSASTHPTEFPGNPHFSGLIGMTHNSNVVLFALGQPASTGIKDMAEKGQKSNLNAEIQSFITEGTAQFVIDGGGVSPSPSDVSLEFDIDLSHPLVTITSMLAPSPDWFIAVHDLNLYENGAWLQDTTLNVGIYDAGTDSGPTFTSANAATSPVENVRTITDPPLAVNGVVATLGIMVFTRIE